MLETAWVASEIIDDAFLFLFPSSLLSCCWCNYLKHTSIKPEILNNRQAGNVGHVGLFSSPSSKMLGQLGSPINKDTSRPLPNVVHRDKLQMV